MILWKLQCYCRGELGTRRGRANALSTMHGFIVAIVKVSRFLIVDLPISCRWNSGVLVILVARYNIHIPKLNRLNDFS